MDKNIPTIDDNETLLRYGICRVPLPAELDINKWAKELSQVTPSIMFGEGDGEYALYRNIMEEEDFPFDIILKSELGKAIQRYFPVTHLFQGQGNDEGEIRLDDAFCVHYNMDQYDTSGAKHTDPSDITINMCLEKSEDTKGSYVLFYGTKQLENVSPLLNSSDNDNQQQENDSMTNDEIEKEEEKKSHEENEVVSKMTTATSNPPESFLVTQIPGYATIHFGNHPHETTSLLHGRRTNIILTYCYTDPTRSDVALRTCYDTT